MSSSFLDHDNSDDDSDGEGSDTSSRTSWSSLVPSVVASSQTSYTAGSSTRSFSPTSSVQSMTSSLSTQIYKQEFGRNLNNFSDVYRLPADDDEFERLNVQHMMFVEALGRYSPPMEEAMAITEPGERKACLDLGCGSGIWILDVARDFPHCDAVGVDLVPTYFTDMPPNCRCEIDDINLGLEHFYGDFDVVHTRLISAGIRDYNRLIDQIGKVLRPRGLIDVTEFDFHSYDENYRRIELDTNVIGPPWWPRWLAFASSAISGLGGDVDAATYLHDWVLNNPDFEQVVYREFWLPASAWKKNDEVALRIGSSMGDIICEFVKSGRPLLLGAGVPEDLVDKLEREATLEIREARVPLYERMQYVYARKKQP